MEYLNQLIGYTTRFMTVPDPGSFPFRPSHISPTSSPSAVPTASLSEHVLSFSNDVRYFGLDYQSIDSISYSILN